MSFLGDALGFEKFHAGDLWDRIKKDPKRLVLGVDPLSTKVWNKVLGKKDEPLVDQLGGAYGGHTISAFGNNDGGVYKRAREAGIDTGAGEKMQDFAHMLASIYGGNGLYGASGGSAGSGVTGPLQTAQGLMGGGSGNGLGYFSNGGKAGLQGMGGGNAGQLAATHGIGGGAGMGAAGSAGSGGFLSQLQQNPQQYLQMMQGGQQQQQPPPHQLQPVVIKGRVWWI